MGTMKKLHREKGRQMEEPSSCLGSLIYPSELEQSQGWRWAFLREGTPGFRVPCVMMTEGSWAHPHPLNRRLWEVLGGARVFR